MARFTTEGSVEKRHWVVVGVCLHSVVIPPLREIIAEEVNKVYNEMKLNYNIHKQDISNCQSNIPRGWKKLDYESINGNIGKSKSEFDYKVRDAVSLAKTFMEPSMAKFNAFDSSFDASAALSVLSMSGLFNPSVNALATNVNSDVRTKWAHPDFTKWTRGHYDNCFTFLMDMVTQTSRHFPGWKTQSSIILNQLKWWKENGTDVCLGKVLDDDHFRDCLHEIKTFAKTVADFRGTLSKEFDRQISDTYKLFEDSLNSVVELLEKKQNSLTEALNKEIKMRENGDNKLDKKIKTVTSLTKSLEKSQVNLANAFTKTTTDQDKKLKENEEKIFKLFETFKMDALQKEEKVEKIVNHMNSKVELLEAHHKALNGKIFEIKGENEELKSENQELKTKVCKMENENQELQAKVRELEGILEASKTGDSDTCANEAFEAPPH